MSATKVCPQCGREESLEVRFCPVDGTALRLTGGADADLVGQIVGDRYHVLRKLGEGGMGTVYLVEHVKMQRKSALKVMNPGMVKDADAISRFNREAANASRINHPNVASVYDFGETPDGLIFLAMEFVDGPALTKVIEEQGALAPMRAATIIQQASEALAVAHDMGIVHRDLKPDNIMVARTRDGADMVKVVDFGIAKAQDSSAQKVTKTGLVVGTPEYMSPEQLAGDKLDGRSDIYSLGLVAFNMLTGTLPFPSDSQQESMIMRLTDKPRPLGAMKADVSWPADVQAVMDKVLERDASLRYQNATEFGRALVAAVERMPQTAVMQAGTMVMSSAGVGGANAPTAAIPATRVASAAEKAAPAAPVGAPSHGAPVTSSNKMGIFAAVGLALVIGGGFAVKSMMNKPDAGAPPNVAPNPVDGAAGKAPDPGATKAPVIPPPGPPATGQPAGGGGGSATKGMTAWNDMQVDDALIRWDDASTDPSTPPAKALSMFDSLKTLAAASKYSNNNQLVRAVLIQAQLLPANRQGEACDLLKTVREKARLTNYAKRFADTFELSNCPP